MYVMSKVVIGSLLMRFFDYITQPLILSDGLVAHSVCQILCVQKTIRAHSIQKYKTMLKKSYKIYFDFFIKNI